MQMGCWARSVSQEIGIGWRLRRWSSLRSQARQSPNSHLTSTPYSLEKMIQKVLWRLMTDDEPMLELDPLTLWAFLTLPHLSPGAIISP